MEKKSSNYLVAKQEFEKIFGAVKSSSLLEIKQILSEHAKTLENSNDDIKPILNEFKVFTLSPLYFSLNLGRER